MKRDRDRSSECDATSDNGAVTAFHPATASATADASVVGMVMAHLRDLTPDPENRRAHNPRNIGLIVDSLQRDGFGRSVLIDENNVLIAGNGVVEAAAEAGIERVRIIEANGDEIIAVRRRGLTDEQKRHLAIADNRATDLSEFDSAQLRADVDAGLDLSAFWSETELADLLGADAPPPRFQPHEAEHQLDALAKHCRTCTCREEVR